MKKLLFALTIVMAAFVFQSCDKEDTLEVPANLKAPSIPPAVLYSIPTYEIAQDSIGSGMEVDTRDPQSNVNWVHAGVSLLVWNSIVVINLALPVNAIGQAFNQNAQYIGNNTFAWTYDYTALPSLGGSTYHVVLTGQYISTDEVEWKLTASEVGGFQNFEWVTAIVATNHQYGEFVINRNPANPQAYIRINSTYNVLNQEASVRLTNVISGDPGNGHYIEYQANATTDLNRFFQLYGGPGTEMEIAWNAPQNYGRVMHKQFFGDTKWHCWDTGFMDTDCN